MEKFVVDIDRCSTVDASILQGSLAVIREYSVPNDRMTAIAMMTMRG